ncbi:MAG: hypothetical protein Q8O88_01915 [bacterium]|nr:hypothetical protein [bacterium]
MANNLRIYQKTKEKRTTNKLIIIKRIYVCDDVDHYFQPCHYELNEDRSVKITAWGQRMQMGPCDKSCGSTNYGYLPEKAEMKFVCRSSLDTAYLKKLNEGKK